MTPFWHPLSGVFLVDPPIPATRGVLSMLLRAGPTEVVYGGDRMEPAVGPAGRVTLEPTGDAPLFPGDAVAASDGEVVDLLRVEGTEGEGIRLSGDADPAEPVTLDRSAVLARARLPRAIATSAARRRRRRGLDLREAWNGRPDGAEAETVRDKYESQAPHYARQSALALEPRLRERIRSRVPVGGRILVVGSGVGTEAIALAHDGFRVHGIDFAPAMVAASRAAASREGVEATFDEADVRACEIPKRSLDAVVFTYDVYSFLPGATSRVEALRRISTWLAPGGRVYLSARRARDPWSQLLLAIQRLRGTRELGDSHTRWFSGGGAIRRSFVHVFTERALRREIARGGGRLIAWEGGHGEVAFEGER